MPNQRLLGIALVTLSAVTFSTAGLFVKGVAAGPYAIVFWRSVGAMAVIYLYTLAQQQVRTEVSRFGWSGAAVAVVGAIGTLAFVPAFKLTTIANVSMIYAAAPFFSAFIAWCWMRERPKQRVLVCSVLVLVGVGIIVQDSWGKGSLTGDLLALVMTVAMALLVCIYRRYPNTPSRGPAFMMALLLIPVGLIFDQPLTLPVVDIALCLAFGFVFALASVTLAEGARRLPAAETALLSALEMPLAPLWAVLLFAEFPSQAAIIGGVLIAAAVIASQWPIRQPRRHTTANTEI